MIEQIDENSKEKELSPRLFEDGLHNLEKRWLEEEVEDDDDSDTDMRRID